MAARSASPRMSSGRSGLRYGAPYSSVAMTISASGFALRMLFAAAIPAGPHPSIR
jgi:hypothetical protein